jgi:hypothetical protein
VEQFMATSIGSVPKVFTIPSFRDRYETVLARVGTIRNTYAIAPGIYAVGSPTSTSPVLVSANYKLSFDTLRFHLAGFSAWILVLDTRGINVWCAAGKQTFSTQEIVMSLERYRVEQLVDHQQIIVPQLAAVAVSAHEVKKRSGFTVIFGPVRASALQEFVANGNLADEAMRTVTFSMAERMVLVPVEFYLLSRQLLVILLVGVALSGIGPDAFSAAAMFDRGLIFVIITIAAVFSGALVVPLFLPWLPGRQFWIKGLFPGLLVGLWCLWGCDTVLSDFEKAAMALWSVAISSYLAMNFTGSTPFTSPTGVEYEMKRGLLVQCLCAAGALVLWLLSPFVI